jgi:hypothetical protein
MKTTAEEKKSCDVPVPHLLLAFCTFYYLAISIESLPRGRGGGRGSVKGGISYPQLNGPECPPEGGGGGGEGSGTQSSCTR